HSRSYPSFQKEVAIAGGTTSFPVAMSQCRKDVVLAGAVSLGPYTAESKACAVALQPLFGRVAIVLRQLGRRLGGNQEGRPLVESLISVHKVSTAFGSHFGEGDYPLDKV
ncbi:MAG: hypothetical protein L0338_35770, partial [Acidobacteria bacterium]|nr:hypothetical protein [Acidobacteriota bacterium]